MQYLASTTVIIPKRKEKNIELTKIILVMTNNPDKNKKQNKNTKTDKSLKYHALRLKIFLY